MSRPDVKRPRLNGSFAEITFATYAPPAVLVVGVRKVHSVSERQLVVWYPRSNVKSTLPLRDEELAALKTESADRNCVQHPERVGPIEFAGTGTFLGMSITKHVFKSQTARSEVWEAPALGCEIVYLKTIFVDANGNNLDASIRSVIEFKNHEPEAWIFGSESSTEMLPSQALSAEAVALAHAAGGIPNSTKDFTRPKFRRQDENYLKRWQERK